ncbi:OmpA family protein [Comamonadaceae bacterium PP-2]
MSAVQQQDDGQSRFALGLVFTLVGIVVVSVLSAVLYHQGVFKTDLTRQQEREIAQSVAPLTGDAAGTAGSPASRVEVSAGVVSFYFAVNSAALPTDAGAALADIVQGVQAGRRAVISGFHDASGDAILNAALAKERAVAVGQTLQGLGVAQGRIEYRRPADSTGTGDAGQARRVEVTLAD